MPEERWRRSASSICGRKSTVMRCDNNIRCDGQPSDRHDDCESSIYGTRSAVTQLRPPPTPSGPHVAVSQRLRLIHFSSLLFALSLASALIVVPLISASDHSASHLLFRRQALADEESEETTTTTSPITTTTATTNVQPILAESAATTTVAPTSPTTVPSTVSGASETSGSSTPVKSKIPPVNFTQVNELFEAVFDDAEVVTRWRHMDKQLTDGK